MSTKRTFCGTAAAIAVLAVMLCGCGSTSSTTQTTEPAANTAAETDAPAATTADAPQTDKVMTLGESKILNFEPPQQGEEIVVINVKDFGTIKIKLFPDAAPEAVENFKGLIGMNYYDELIFHRVIPNFMIQGGDPRGNGTGGNSMYPRGCTTSRVRSPMRTAAALRRTAASSTL